MPVDLQTCELIARGAQGSVFLVFDRSQGRFLALKLVDVAGDEAASRRLLAFLLANASGAPNSPGAVIDFGRGVDAPPGVASAFPTRAGGERIWILMHYIHGPNARELALGDRAFGPTEVAALLAQVATSLRTIHPQSAHLDLKPENVLVDRRGVPHLVDFHMGTPEGTSAYAAPEQRGKGGTPGPASDLYALGKLGAWLLAREFPAADADPELFPAGPEPAADLPAERRRNTKELGQLLRGLCHSDPAKRGTIEEVAKRLLEIAAALGGVDMAAPLVASVARAKLPERLERLTAAMAQEPAASKRAEPLPQGEGEAASSRRPLVLGVLFAAAILGGGEWWLLRPRIPPPTAVPAASPPVVIDAAFSKTAPERHGIAVPVEEQDKIAMDRALFELQPLFSVQSLAILSRNGDVVDRIEKPVYRHIYRWDVQPNVTLGYEVRRDGYGPEVKQVPPLEERGMLRLEVERGPESAPLP